MFCKICGKSNFKKEGDSFVCQECLTEYSEAEAKSLMKEVADNATPTPYIGATVQASSQSQDAVILYNYYQLYQKGHELENSFQYKDMALLKCSDIYSPDYPGDITVRELDYSHVKEAYLSDKKQINRIKAKVLEAANNDEETKEAYKEYLSYSKKEKILTRLGWTISIIGVIFFFLGIGCGVTKCVQSFGSGYQEDFMHYFLWSSIGGGAAFAIIGVFIASHYDYVSTYNYEEWVTHGCDSMAERGYYYVFGNIKSQSREETEKKYVKIFEEERAKHIKEIDAMIENFLKKVEALKKVKKELLRKYPLPTKYSDEVRVTILLGYIADRRADNLKEAINVYEDEIAKAKMMNSISELQNKVNHSLSSMRQEMVRMDKERKRLMTEQNKQIMDAISNIKVDIDVKVE